MSGGEREGGGMATGERRQLYKPCSVRLLVGVMMEVGPGEPLAMLGTRAAELAVCRELLLSSRAIASLFSFERRFWNQT